MANKKQQEAYYKGQLRDAALMKSLGKQLIAKATQIESGAKGALAALGAKPERPPKGYQLPDETRIELIASLTKSKHTDGK